MQCKILRAVNGRLGHAKNEKKTTTWERKLFSEIYKLEFSRDLAGKFNLSHTHRRQALDW